MIFAFIFMTSFWSLFSSRFGLWKAWQPKWWKTPLPRLVRPTLAMKILGFPSTCRGAHHATGQVSRVLSRTFATPKWARVSHTALAVTVTTRTAISGLQPKSKLWQSTIFRQALVKVWETHWTSITSLASLPSLILYHHLMLGGGMGQLRLRSSLSTVHNRALGFSVTNTTIPVTKDR